MSGLQTTAGPEAPDEVLNQEWMNAQVETAIRELPFQPRMRVILRGLAGDYPDLFFRAAADHFESGPVTTTDSVLAVLMLKDASVFQWLTNPVRRCEQAVKLFRRLLALDATLDFQLARMLPGRNDSAPDHALHGKYAARAIEILDLTSPGQRLLSVLGHLPNSSDPQISAKATLFVGRRVNNPAWFERQMIREDPRLRANALEGAWGTKSEKSLRILEESLDDTNNRVAGNALVGLHLAGDPDVVQRAIAMSRSDDPARRATVLWAMGKIGEPAFIPSLVAFMRDDSPRVRSTAIRSLVEIRRAEEGRAAAELASRPEVETPPPSSPVESETPKPELGELPMIDIRLDGSSFRARAK